jgi:hypothetical protein
MAYGAVEVQIRNTTCSARGLYTGRFSQARANRKHTNEMRSSGSLNHVQNVQLAAPSPHVQRHHLMCGGVHGPPEPWLVGLLRHKAPHGGGCSREVVKPYGGWTGGEPQRYMIGAAGQAFHPEVQQPRQADAHRTASPAQGEAFTQQVGHLRCSTTYTQIW